VKSPSWLRAQLRKHAVTDSDLRVGVDGGAAHWLGQNLPPQILIGDWDSLEEDPTQNPQYQSAQILTLPRVKDRSDLFYALEVLESFKIQELLCFGFNGGRPDHQLSNLMEFAHFAARERKIAAIGEDAEYYWVSPSTPLELSADSDGSRVVSVFAWNGEASGVSLKGMEYSLKDKKLAPSSRGLSNLIKSDRVGVRVKRGLLLVVFPAIGIE
jgi:thiamine pyrophosphokinase